MATGNHDPAIDGVYTGPTINKSADIDASGVKSEISSGKGLYTRQQLLYALSGAVDPSFSSGVTPDIRRVWPDEPNVGLAEEDMSLLVDAALRIGGPTLKTYLLNKRGDISQVQETRLTHVSDLQQLRGSENGGPMADVFHQVTSSYQSADIAGTGLYAFDTTDISNTDFYTYSLLDAANDTIMLRRPGTYLVKSSLSATADAVLGYSEVELQVNFVPYRTVSFQWNCALDAIIEVTSQDTTFVQFVLTIGDIRVGALRRSYVSIEKIR